MSNINRQQSLRKWLQKPDMEQIFSVHFHSHSGFSLLAARHAAIGPGQASYRSCMETLYSLQAQLTPHVWAVSSLSGSGAHLITHTNNYFPIRLFFFIFFINISSPHGAEVGAALRTQPSCIWLHWCVNPP